MTLSASQLQQISGQLIDELSIQRSESDRRNPRVKVEGKLTLVPFGQDGCSFNVSFRDISATGLKLQHTDRLPLDGQFVALLPQFGEAIPMLCQVVYWEPVGPGLFGVGMRFVRVLSEAEHQSSRRSNSGGIFGRIYGAIERRIRAAS